MSTQCSRNNVAPPETRRRPCLKRGCFCQLSFWTELDYATRRKRRRKKKTHTKKAQTSLFTGAFCTADMQLELTGTFKKKKKPTTHTHKRELVGRPPCQDRNPDEGFFLFFMPISPSCCRVLLVSNSEFHFFFFFFWNLAHKKFSRHDAWRWRVASASCELNCMPWTCVGKAADYCLSCAPQKKKKS